MAKSRTAKATLFKMLQGARLPVYAVSSNMKIVFCNDALCQLTGRDDEFLTSLTCVYQSATDQNPDRQLASGLCPPVDAFSGQPQNGWIHLLGPDRTNFYQASFVPFADPDPSSDAPLHHLLVVVYGAAKEAPEIDKPSDQFDSRDLHASIRQMQYASSRNIGIDRLVGSSASSQRIRRQVQVAGATESNVVILGPAGSGRRNLATLIHYANGPEMVGPIIPIDCSVTDSETVQETIKSLYRSHRQYPDEPLGRVFLQDVERLDPQAQKELLGFLNLPDFRLPMIATGSPAAQAIVNADLWQHLQTITIEIPCLRDRRQDISFLAQAILEQSNGLSGKQLAGIEDAVLQELKNYSWPGELNELTDAIDHACQNAADTKIQFDDLPQHLRIAMRVATQSSNPPRVEIDLDQFLAEIEEELIQRAMQHSAGNKSEAARLLGISRARLLRRLDDGPSQEETPDFREASE